MLSRARLMGAMASAMLLLPVAAHAQQIKVDDSSIRDAVEHRLEFDPEVPSQVITVYSDDGIVTLTGATHELLTKQRAARIAETVRGVRAVVNRIDVEPVAARSDRDLSEDVREAILMDPATDSYEIDETAENGRVTLTGTVDSWAEKDLAEKVAEGVTGVTGIDNRIEVKPAVTRSDAEIETDVVERLRWDVRVDGGMIDTEVDSGSVKLSGVVGSAAEKRQAEDDAWVDGVTDVDASGLKVRAWAREDELRVKPPALTSADIEQAIHRALFYDPRVLSTAVEADVAPDHTVTLRGDVANLAAARAATRDAWNTTGVRFVQDRLKVRPKGTPVDSIVSRTVERSLRRDPYVHASDVSVDVDNGAVRLEGEVDNNFERARADEIASRATGVRRVENDLIVAQPMPPLLFEPFVDQFRPEDFTWYNPTPVAGRFSDEQIKDQIRQQLFWSPWVKASDVSVSVDDGVATLTGVVDSYTEKARATESAYEGGASLVDNELTVNGQ